MGTVTGNRGTVLEHIALSCAVPWAIETSRSDGGVQYLDTHAMAPVNHSIGDEFLVRVLERVANDPIQDAPNPGAQAYCDTLRRSALLRQAGSANYYPTHFVHAALAAQARDLTAYLFENDGGGHPAFQGRRAEIEDFLRTPQAQTVIGVQPSRLQGALAPLPGDFRQPGCWAAPAPQRGSALVVFNDPMGFTRRRQQRSGGPPAATYMDAADLLTLRDQIERVYLDRPRLTVQVIFVMSRHGRATLANYEDYFHWVAEAWRANFVPGQVAPAFRRCGGIKWALFMVFVGAYLRSVDEEPPVPESAPLEPAPQLPPAPPPPLADTFDELLVQVEQTVQLVEPGASTTVFRGD
jgi:hypothetical protein